MQINFQYLSRPIGNSIRIRNFHRDPNRNFESESGRCWQLAFDPHNLEDFHRWIVLWQKIWNIWFWLASYDCIIIFCFSCFLHFLNNKKLTRGRVTVSQNYNSMFLHRNYGIQCHIVKKREPRKIYKVNPVQKNMHDTQHSDQSMKIFRKQVNGFAFCGRINMNKINSYRIKLKAGWR